MIRHNGKNWIPAGVKPVLGRRRGAPVNGRPKARWIAGWVGGFGEPSDPTACDFTFSPIFPPSPTPTSTVTPTVTPTSSITPTPTVTPTATVTPTPSTSVPSGDPDAALLLSDVLAAGGTLDATISAATETLFTELKSNGFYDKLVFYPFIGGNAASHALFGKRTSGTTYDMTFNGGMTHSASGITCNGTNSNADWTALPWSASTATQGNRSTGIYSVKAPNPTGNQYDVGSYNTDTWPLSSQLIRFGGNSYIGWNVGFTTTPNTDVLGFFANSLTGATSGTVTFFENGSSVGTGTSNDDFNTTTPNANSVGGWLGADRGTDGFYSDKTFCWFYLGQYFTNTEMGTLSTIINDYQTSLGRNTY